MCAGGSEKHLHRPKRSDWDCHWSSSLPGVWTVGINPKEEGRRRRSQQNSCRCCLAKALRRWEESGRRRKRWPEAEKRVSSGLSPRWLLLTPTWNQPWPSSTARHHRHLSPACAAVPLGRKATASRQNVANGPSNVLCFFPFPVARPSFSITRWKSPRFLLASYYGNWARHLITVNSSCRPTQQIPGRQNRKSHGKGEKRKTFPRCLVASSSSSSLASLYMFNAPWMATEAEGTGSRDFRVFCPSLSSSYIPSRCISLAALICLIFSTPQTETTNTVVVFRSFHVIGICPAGTDRSSSPCCFFASAKSLLHRRVYLHDYRLSFFIIFHPRRHGLMGLLCADARDDRPGWWCAGEIYKMTQKKDVPSCSIWLAENLKTSCSSSSTIKHALSARK